MFSCVVDEIVAVPLLIIGTLYSLMVDVSATIVETSGSTSSVIIEDNVDPLDDSFKKIVGNDSVLLNMSGKPSFELFILDVSVAVLLRVEDNVVR
jgi:hypothetical protein